MVIWSCLAVSLPSFPAGSYLLSVCMCVSQWIDMCWQPGSLHQSPASPSDRRPTDWWGGEQQSGKWAGSRKMEGEDGSVVGKRGRRGREGRTSGRNQEKGVKGRNSCDCAGNGMGEEESVMGTWWQIKKVKKKKTKNEEADLIAAECISVMLVQGCRAADYNKKCDLWSAAWKVQEPP